MLGARVNSCHDWSTSQPTCREGTAVEHRRHQSTLQVNADKDDQKGAAGRLWVESRLTSTLAQRKRAERQTTPKARTPAKKSRGQADRQVAHKQGFLGTEGETVSKATFKAEETPRRGRKKRRRGSPKAPANEVGRSGLQTSHAQGQTLQRGVVSSTTQRTNRAELGAMKSKAAQRDLFLSEQNALCVTSQTRARDERRDELHPTEQSSRATKQEKSKKIFFFFHCVKNEANR